ncbi:hypothetical protein J3F84DRAFT_356855, partial [Trichoderma pleuroticola]
MDVFGFVFGEDVLLLRFLIYLFVCFCYRVWGSVELMEFTCLLLFILPLPCNLYRVG